MTEPIAAAFLEFNDAAHPHKPSGPGGGQFATTNTTTSTSKPIPVSHAPLSPSGIRQGNFKTGGSAAALTVAAKPSGLSATLKRGKANDPADVAQLQAMIRELGLGQVDNDGNFGANTEASVKALQAKLGLKPTGSVSSALMKRLHDAHTLSPCIDRSTSKVNASASYVDDEWLAAAAGHDVTPGHDELHHYWTVGKGRQLWIHSPTPWTTLVALLSEHVPLEKAKVFASRWFIETHGYSAGSDLNRVAHGHPPRGHRVGPG